MTAFATSVSATAGRPGRFASSLNAREPASHLRAVPADRTAFATEMEQIGKTVTYARGKAIVEEGGAADYIFRVASGALRSVRLLPDGRRCITSFLLPGDFFGFNDGGLSSHSVEALSDVTLVRYPVASFAALLDRSPSAARHFFHMVCSELSAAQERLLLLGRKSALERLASFLVSLADRQPTKVVRSGAVLTLPMSRGDVADYLGLTVETVSRLLATLRSRRTIDVPNATDVVLLDREGLRAIGDGETELD